MIDFNNAAFIKLKPTNDDAFVNNISPILVKGESILGTYKGIRDGVVFTTHRIIAINVQGITGKKKDFTSLPYSKIQTFSIETAGTFDLDRELELWFSSLGKVQLEFSSRANVSEIAKIISQRVL